MYNVFQVQNEVWGHIVRLSLNVISPKYANTLIDIWQARENPRNWHSSPRNRKWVEDTALCSLGDGLVSRGAAHGRLGCGSRSARSAQHVRIARHNAISLMVEWELGCGSRGTRSAWHVRIVGRNMISLMAECDLGLGSRSTTHSR